MRMLKKYPKIVQQLEEQASNKAASYNFATDVTEEAYWAGDLNTCGNQTLLKTAAPQYKLSQLPPKAPKAEALEARLKEPNSNPVMVLNEIAGPAVQFYFIEERGEKQQKEFVLKALFNGEEHFATGRSKKDAKFKAACAILQKHFGVMNPANVSNTSVVGDEAPNGDTNAITHFEFANQMQKLVKDKFMELTVRSGSNYNKYKVIAGIVMTTNEQWDDYQLISVTTGTKTIKGENLSMSGTVLHDCHAEILSKRCLRKFLYSQLNSVVSSGSTEGSILEEIIIQNKSCGYRVKSGVRFHLYINTTPCGDARIFSPHEVDQGNDAHPDRKNRGLIRVKIEAGEGTIPSTNEDFGTQTFDGVLAGERLLNLSCSDKVLRMNVLGMQGGLLSWFLEPVYLSSIVIGSFYHADHLERAVISRFKESSENDKKLAAPFRLSRPMLCSVDIQEARQASKSLPYSMNWTCVDGDAMEIVDTSTGKLIETSVVSSISKQSMFGEFKALLQTEISVRNTAAVSNDKEPRTYRECKSHSTDYIKSKKEFIRSLQQSELGQWLTKPQEVDSFT
ncbi:double-stranded RNA-specific editase Adar-like [Symsagittifera roscoffensis]|uniref:double-stranded RNA-specific editase Adar-like n=1 Tax=Symsagittifera roscoffensis TaxID=84072 RepID=UPI00307B9202